MGYVDNVVLTVLIIVITSCILYDKVYLESKKDVHELSLQEQSSISSTRKAGESAIYRSLDVMHGLPLAVGLQVRYDVYKIRNGNLKDVWKLAMANCDHLLTLKNGSETKTITFQDLNIILYKVSLTLNQIAPSKKIGIYSSVNDFNSLTVILSAFFYTNHVLQNFTKIPQLKNDDIELICCLGKDLNSFIPLGYSKFIIVDDAVVSARDGIEIIGFSQLLNQKGPEDPSQFDYKYVKEDDFYPVLVDTVNFKEIEYSQINFVSAIAAQLRSLPMEHMWGASDKLLVEIGGEISSSTHNVLLNQNFIIKFLCGLVSGVKEVILAPGKDIDLQLINVSDPTILSVSESTLDRIISTETDQHTSKLSPVESLTFKISSHWFSRGIFNTLFKHHQIPKLRIIYTEIFSDPRLSSSQVNHLQTAFSTRLVSEKFKFPLLGPFLKTNFYDYRILANECSNGKLSLKKLGIPANCLELKVRDHDELKAENNEGELVCRGFNIGKVLEQRVKDTNREGDGEGWMPTGVIGKWGEDGCFYEYL